MADEAALAALRSELLLQLGEMRGDIRLILQSMEHQASRAEEHRQALASLDARVDEVERTAVTREELARREEQAGQAASRRLTVIGLVITVVNIVIGSGIALAAIALR